MSAIGNEKQGDAQLDAQPENARAGTLEQPDGRRWGRKCPHCKGPSKIRTSTHITENYVEITRICKNVFCGFIWVDLCYGTRTLSASMTPDWNVTIPLSRHINKAKVTAALQQTSGVNPGRHQESTQAAIVFNDPNDTGQVTP